MTAALLILLFAGWLAVVVFTRRFRIWLVYYVVGTVGAAYWLVFFIGEVLRAESWLAYSVAWTVHIVSNGIGIPTQIFENAPGLLLVMVVVQNVGWTVLQVGVESSGLLELCVLTSLLAFYPGWSLRRRAGAILAGDVAIWVANIIRMLIIVIMLNRLGKDALVLAHVYVGKMVFFLLAVGIFWYLITSLTLRDLRLGRFLPARTSARPASRPPG
jgi:exosortase family protein XrtG